MKTTPQTDRSCPYLPARTRLPASLSRYASRYGVCELPGAASHRPGSRARTRQGDVFTAVIDVLACW